jgi:hypothetical protein
MEHNSLKCGSDVIVFDKHKNQIAKGRAVVGTEHRVGVQLTSGKLYDELMKQPQMLLGGDLKYTYLFFGEFSGLFINFNFSDDLSDEVEQLVDGIRAANEFEFGWGMVNSVFATYPGFRGSIKTLPNDC